MVFGLMRESTHKEIVAQLEARIDYLETKSYGLQTLADAQRNKLSKLTEQVVETKSAPVQATVAAAAPVKKVNMVKRDSKLRLALIEEALPKVKFERRANTIVAKFNGKDSRVRVSKAAAHNSGIKRFSFINVQQGDICITVNDDNTLRSVFVAKKDMCTKGGRIYIFQDTEQDLNLIQNTSLVLRNFK